MAFFRGRRKRLLPDQMLRLGVIAAVVLVTAVTQSPVPAQDVFADIDKHQERYEKLQRDILTSQQRILSSEETFGAQELAYSQLDVVYSALESINREFDILSTLITLASLVTDKRAIPQARGYVELQLKYMAKRASHSAEFIEKQMHRVRDPETSRLLIEARDLLRSSVDFFGRTRAKDSKK